MRSYRAVDGRPTSPLSIGGLWGLRGHGPQLGPNMPKVGAICRCITKLQVTVSVRHSYSVPCVGTISTLGKKSRFLVIFVFVSNIRNNKVGHFGGFTHTKGIYRPGSARTRSWCRELIACFQTCFRGS